ncbi:hypothetical protein GIB67_021793 [Kingdonia uniflora]|uniref:Uncharacterized protein n=1 Tax=Kingdonia uniflora TaxID=39325 RepID=A0A7J7P2M0_9MAGN|nr:hypothetical protein GIB67_021793 [Kingdonia uniflora]
MRTQRTRSATRGRTTTIPIIYDAASSICTTPKLLISDYFVFRLDQGLSDMYSCPTCRRPLFVSRSVNSTSPSSGEIPTDEQLVRQISSALDHQNPPTQGLPIGVLPNHTRTPSETIPWRVGLDSSWSQGLDGAGPSNNAIRSVGLGRVQMMMRHIASVGETYAQTALEDAAWSLWPMPHPQTAPGTSAPTAVAASTLRYTGNTGGLRFRNVTPSVNENIANILSMAETVREVLPHVPDELIFQVIHNP